MWVQIKDPVPSGQKLDHLRGGTLVEGIAAFSYWRNEGTFARIP